jgi:ribosomal protein S18 acetylase RimI-like enzyme
MATLFPAAVTAADSTPPISFRAATVKDCYTMAQLFQIAADGVVDYIWHTLEAEYPGLTPLQIGATRYANPDSLFSYKNAIFAEQKGEITGMMLTFPIEPAGAEAAATPPSEFPAPKDSAEPDVLAPYALEKPDTWYICALAVFPEFRNQGIGTQFIQQAHHQAAARGYRELSLLCFEQNTGAARLYRRLGFQEVDRVPVVPHPLIHFTGDLLLMTAPVQE